MNNSIYITINGKKRKVTVIEQQGKPPWYDIKLTIGRNPINGKNRRRDYRAHSLEELTNTISHDIRTGVLPIRHAAGGKITVAELTDLFMRNHCKNLEPKTLQRYQLLARKIKALLGNCPAADLTGSIVSSCCLKIRDRAARDHFHQDGVTAANDFRAFLSRIMEYGVLLHFVRQNPCRYVPKLRHVRHMKILPDLKTLSRYLKALDNEDICGDLLAVTFLLGLRISETQALKRKDIDRDHGAVWIRSHIVYHSTDQGPCQNYLKEGRKEHDEYVTILTEGVLRYIDRAINRAQKWQESAKSRYNNPDGFIFTNASGKTLLYTTIERHHRHAAESVGLKDFTIHDLRRTMASLLFDQTDSVSIVKALLGHGDPQVTLRYILPTRDTHNTIRSSINDIGREIQQAGQICK